MVKRTVLIVSPYFPPSTVAGVHRARHLVKHLPAVGWEPIVLCVDEAYHEELLDSGLGALVPLNIEIIKVRAISAKITRSIGVGEISIRAWYFLRNSLLSLLETGRIDVVLISGSPYYPMLFARETKRRFSLPTVLDFQDPWVSHWGADQPWHSKAALVHRIATVLEPRALRSADFVTSVSDVQNAEMLARYPWFDASRMAAIPIGGDPDDFVVLRDTGPLQNEIELERGFVHLSYVGTFLPRGEAVVRTLFRAFARLRVTRPALASRIRLNFVGTSNQPREVSIYRVRSIAEAEGVAEAVREIPGRVFYLHALSVLARSNGVLLLGSEEPHYTASKIYPGLMCGRPYLSLFHRSSSAHAILAAAGGGRALAFETRGELAELENAIAESLQTLALTPEHLGVPNPAVYEPFQANYIASRFAKIFDSLV